MAGIHHSEHGFDSRFDSVLVNLCLFDTPELRYILVTESHFFGFKKYFIVKWTVFKFCFHFNYISESFKEEGGDHRDLMKSFHALSSAEQLSAIDPAEEPAKYASFYSLNPDYNTPVLAALYICVDD